MLYIKRKFLNIYQKEVFKIFLKQLAINLIGIFFLIYTTNQVIGVTDKYSNILKTTKQIANSFEITILITSIMYFFKIEKEMKPIVLSTFGVSNYKIHKTTMLCVFLTSTLIITAVNPVLISKIRKRYNKKTDEIKKTTILDKIDSQKITINGFIKKENNKFIITNSIVFVKKNKETKKFFIKKAETQNKNLFVINGFLINQENKKILKIQNKIIKNIINISKLETINKNKHINNKNQTNNITFYEKIKVIKKFFFENKNNYKFINIIQKDFIKEIFKPFFFLTIFNFILYFFIQNNKKNLKEVTLKCICFYAFFSIFNSFLENLNNSFFYTKNILPFYYFFCYLFSFVLIRKKEYTIVNIKKFKNKTNKTNNKILKL